MKIKIDSHVPYKCQELTSGEEQLCIIDFLNFKAPFFDY